MMDFLSFCVEYDLERARSGDLAPLADRIRRGDDLSDDARQFLADFLEGKIRFRPGTKTGRMQNKGNRNAIKRALGCNDRIDVEASHAVHWLVQEMGVSEVNARRKVAEILGDTEKNIKYRLNRYKQSMRLVHVIGRMGDGDERKPLLLILADGNK